MNRTKQIGPQPHPPLISAPAQARNEDALLARATRKILEEKDLSRVLQTICEEACRVLGADRSLVAKIGASGDPRRKVLSSHSVSPDFIEAYEETQTKSIFHEALQDKQLKVILEFSKESKVFSPELAHSYGLQSACVIPLIVEGISFGALVLYHLTPKEYSQQERELAGTYGDLASIAIEKAQLIQKNEQRATRLEIVDQIAKAVASHLEPDELFKTIAKEIRRVIPCDRIVIESQDLEGMNVQQFHEEGGAPMGPPSPSNFRHGLISQEVYKKKQALNIPDLLNSPWGESRHAKYGYQSAISVPILQRDQRIAHIFLASLETEAFTQAHEELLSSIAAHLGPAIRNATLYQMAEDREKRLSALVEATQRLSRGLDLGEVLKAIAEVSALLFNGEAGLRIREGDEMVLIASTMQATERHAKRVPVESSITGYLAKTGVPFVTSDSENDPEVHLIRGGINRYQDSMAIMGVPVKMGEGVIGSLFIQRKKGYIFDDESVRIATSLADQAAIAIENARLHENSEERGKRLSALVDAAQRLTRGLDLAEVLQAIAEASALLFGGEAGFRIREGDEMILAASTNGANQQQADRITVENSITGYVAKTGKPFATSDNENDPIRRGVKRYKDSRAVLCVPVKLGEHVLGILFIQREKGYVFDDEVVRIATSLADQAAIAIENARLHEEANKSLEFFRSVVDDNADAIFVVNREDQIILWNTGAEKLYGYTEGEALGKKFEILLPEEERGIDRGINRGKLTSEMNETLHFEAERFRKDGSSVPVSITLSPVRSKDGTFIATSAIHKDLTERKKVEEALRQSEERMRAVMENAADSIITIDEDGIVESFNPAAEKLFGYLAEEIIGQNVNTLMTDLDRGVHDKYLSQYRNTGQGKIISVGPREVEGLRKDGATFSLDLAVTETIIGERRLFIGMMRDITERKRAEEKLLFALGEAEAASMAKSDFLSTMSHELRSPLNAVIGFSELIMRDAKGKDEMTLQLVEKIKDAGKYLLRMIEEILDLDRIEAGKVTLKIAPTSINDIVSGVVSAWHPRLPAGFSLSLETDPKCGVAPCDSTRIQQILNNLIDNAVKYSPEGGIIGVQTRANGDEVWMSIRDEGMGISPAAMESIFERFHQLEKGYTRRAGGLGIGLALARELMEMHGGRIWVESKEGCGSTFHIALPKNDPNKENASRDGNGKQTPTRNEEPWEGRTILVVDDVEHYHEYMRLLMKSTARIDSAYNGMEAIEAVRRENPDLILMDLRMPILDGFDAIERLKIDPNTKDIPIIAVTAQAMEEDRVRSLQAGANGFVTKPVEIDAFSKEMWRVLGVRI